jgi:hypothetical protein
MSKSKKMPRKHVTLMHAHKQKDNLQLSLGDWWLKKKDNCWA